MTSQVPVQGATLIKEIFPPLQTAWLDCLLCFEVLYPVKLLFKVLIKVFTVFIELLSLRKRGLGTHSYLAEHHA